MPSFITGSYLFTKTLAQCCIHMIHYCLKFQARNPGEYSKMVEHIHKTRETVAATTQTAAGASTSATDRHLVTVSIEIEEIKPELRALIPLADVVSTSVQLSGMGNTFITKIHMQYIHTHAAVCKQGVCPFTRIFKHARCCYWTPNTSKTRVTNKTL